MKDALMVGSTLPAQTNMTRGSRRAAALLAMAMVTMHGAAAADGDATSRPTQSSLIVSYRSTPAGRPALLHTLRARLAPRLHALQAEGRLMHYRILFSRLADANTWDALLILDFRTDAQAASWRAVDAETPAGLAATDLAQVTAVESTPSDPVGKGGPADDGPDPVYMVVPYDYFVPTKDYIAYARSYVFPQTDGWIAAGALNAYQLYIARYGAGRNWMSMLVLAYHGDNGLDRRNDVVAATRKALSANPDWAARATGKGHIRTEKAAMIADLIAGG
ncbi:hypothetical protein [Gluconacetobacter asukensis]|uniref:Uncharacterized protein n=1 Tax=Gluconacetobacter asukensis TaxID=1017181 RepID=A0A7W4IYD0_9PROT|nr:hypothetical protein [Gluconacetobacter asukensis]MBB2171017.1 hypothetical protein [Gluconacetobacter asukensis]